MPYRPGLTYKDGVAISVRSRRLPRRLRARARPARLRGVAQAPGRPACDGRGASASASPAMLRAPGSGLRGRDDPRRSERQGLRLHRRRRAGPGPRDHARAGRAPPSWARDSRTCRSGRRHDTGAVRHGHRRQPRDRQRRSRRRAHRARGARPRPPAWRAELLECAPEDVRIEAGRVFVAGMPDALGAARPRGQRRGEVEGAQADRRARASTPARTTIPDTVTWAFGTQRRRGRGRRGDVRDPLAEVRGLARSGPRHQSADRRGPAPGRRSSRASAPGLMEEVVYDDDGAAPDRQPHGLRDPAKPTTSRAIDVALDEHRSVINDLGVKGVGESGCIAPAGAIANAVEDAVADLGVTLTEVPVTSARLYRRSHGSPPRPTHYSLAELAQRGVAGGRPSRRAPCPRFMASRSRRPRSEWGEQAADDSTGPRPTPSGGWGVAASPAPNAERRPASHARGRRA